MSLWVKAFNTTYQVVLPKPTNQLTNQPRLTLTKSLDTTTSLQKTKAKQHDKQHHRNTISKIQIVKNYRINNSSTNIWERERGENGVGIYLPFKKHLRDTSTNCKVKFKH